VSIVPGAYAVIVANRPLALFSSRNEARGHALEIQKLGHSPVFVAYVCDVVTAVDVPKKVRQAVAQASYDARARLPVPS